MARREIPNPTRFWDVLDVFDVVVYPIIYHEIYEIHYLPFDMAFLFKPCNTGIQHVFQPPFLTINSMNIPQFVGMVFETL